MCKDNIESKEKKEKKPENLGELIVKHKAQSFFDELHQMGYTIIRRK